MKKIVNVLILGAISLIVASCATTRIPADYSGISCGTPVIEILEDQTVNIQFQVEVPANYFDKRITFCIMPSIVYANGEVQTLPYYTVQGLAVVDTNFPVVDWSKRQVLTYQTSIPYHDGLATAVLRTEAWIENCLTREEMLKPLCDFGDYAIRIPLAPVLPVYEAQSVDESTTRATLKGKIFFPVNGYIVTSSIATQPEITRTLNSLKRFIQRDDFNITRITVEGNASPEGTPRINDPLARRRAEHTRNFFDKALKEHGYTKTIPADAWTVTSTSGMGFWNEFYTAMKESSIGNKEELAEKFLRLATNPAEAEKQIRYEIASNAEVKNVMMPLLRYGSVSVSFDPLKLTAEEVRAIAADQPEYLTPNDIIQASKDMENDNIIALYKRGLDRYPESVELYINLSYHQIQAGYLDDALKTLEDAGLVAAEQNQIDMIKLQQACIAMKQGNYNAAEALLNQVEDAQSARYYKGVLAIYRDENDKALDLLADTKDINYAVALLNSNKVREALGVLQGLDQDDPYVLYATGVAYGRLNKAEKAEEYKAKAFRLDPSLQFIAY